MPNLSPYITPQMLTSAATGIQWSTIGGKSNDPQATLAEMTEICWRVTHQIDAFCNQVLRATLDSETITAPSFRCTVRPNGVARMLLSRWPVLSLTGGNISPATSFPASYTAVTSSQLQLEYSALGTTGSVDLGASGAGPSAALLAPGVVNWMGGRNGYTLQINYVSGWPHCGVTAAVSTGTNTLTVDDITGWTNVVGTLHNGKATEVNTVQSVTPAVGGATSGPGTLTMVNNWTYAHTAPSIDRAPLLFTALPGTVQQAAILLSVSEALLRGATSTGIMAAHGSISSGGDMTEMTTEAEVLLYNYRRVI